MAIYKHRKERGSEPLFGPSPSETDLFQKQFEDLILQQEDSGEQSSAERLFLNELLDISSTIQEGVSAIADDSFTRCFKENHPDPWNWNAYLFPLWCMGVVLQYGVLFPLRLILLIVGWLLFAIIFFPWHFLVPKSKLKLRKKYERLLIEYMCSVFVASWTGVIKYHGPRPSRGQNKVWVANHTSMIDFLILEQVTPFAVIMQLHGGWVGPSKLPVEKKKQLQRGLQGCQVLHFVVHSCLEGFVQTHILDCLGCIWFNRTEAKDRAAVAKKLQQHVRDGESNPLLIFPEGTCVNNEYCVMFKKGAFELGATVCPIAIKYNKIFVDAFWNSKRQSFTMHLMRLMTSWAVVCDVYYLEPQTQREGESVIEFAERVQTLICDRINIKKVPWDGYLKYYRPSPKLTEKRQQKFAEKILKRLDAPPAGRTNKPAIPKVPSGRSMGLPPKSPPRERPGVGANGANTTASSSEDPLSKASIAKSGASFEVGTGPDKDAGTGTGTALDYPLSATSNLNGLKGSAA